MLSNTVIESLIDFNSMSNMFVFCQEVRETHPLHIICEIVSLKFVFSHDSIEYEYFYIDLFFAEMGA